ncbi:MAG: hypothetical protein HC769_24690 [Cyanobacteria bacterium CRU_2_1]|nr:hypothetical protein [Cyanobacteria bacterium CRU_2_1]
MTEKNRLARASKSVQADIEAPLKQLLLVWLEWLLSITTVVTIRVTA